jgi:hypothetical protein
MISEGREEARTWRIGEALSIIGDAIAGCWRSAALVTAQSVRPRALVSRPSPVTPSQERTEERR